METTPQKKTEIQGWVEEVRLEAPCCLAFHLEIFGLPSEWMLGKQPKFMGKKIENPAAHKSKPKWANLGPQCLV